MLFQRVITALLLIPLVVVGVLYLPTELLSVVLALIVMLGALEWSRIAGLSSTREKQLFLLLLFVLLCGTYLLVKTTEFSGWLFAAASLFWCLVMLKLIFYRAKSGLNLTPPEKAGIGLLVLIPAWAALVVIHGQGEQGPVLVLFLLTLIWVADTGAYFSGRLWGRVKLAPEISPGKTREGVYGALVGAALWGGLLAWIMPELGTTYTLILLSLVVCIISVVGDLFESVFKRLAGVKDSGNLLPGHGGVLDRIDSLAAAAPVFAFGLFLLGTG